MSPDEKANNNILFVLQKLRNLELQNSSLEIEYKIGKAPMSFKEEVEILLMLQGKKVLQINDSWGNDSPF